MFFPEERAVGNPYHKFGKEPQEKEIGEGKNCLGVNLMGGWNPISCNEHPVACEAKTVHGKTKYLEKKILQSQFENQKKDEF